MKVLVVLDVGDGARDDDGFDSDVRCLRECLEEFADADFAKFDSSRIDPSGNPYRLQMAVDAIAAGSGRYDLVIADGLAAYFWLHCQDRPTLLALDPELHPESSERVSSENAELFGRLHRLTGGWRVYDAGCVIGRPHAEYEEECGNLFPAQTVAVSDKPMSSLSFWLPGSVFYFMTRFLLEGDANVGIA